MSSIACGLQHCRLHVATLCPRQCTGDPFLPALEKDMDLASESSTSEENFGMPQLRMLN